MAGWAHFQHMADIGVHGWGATPVEAFEQAALALTAVITDLESVHPDTAVELACKGTDLELLLVDWLNACIYAMGVRKMLFSRFAIDLQEDGLEGRAWGEAVVVDRHHPAVEIKGATYTALEVGQEVDQAVDARWHARCVVDV